MLEKHLIQLLNRLDGFEHVREQLELQERPSSLLESRDSVRRHVDAQDVISKVQCTNTSTCVYVCVNIIIVGFYPNTCEFESFPRQLIVVFFLL